MKFSHAVAFIAVTGFVVLTTTNIFSSHKSGAPVGLESLQEIRRSTKELEDKVTDYHRKIADVEALSKEVEDLSLKLVAKSTDSKARGTVPHDVDAKLSDRLATMRDMRKDTQHAVGAGAERLAHIKPKITTAKAAEKVVANRDSKEGAAKVHDVKVVDHVTPYDPSSAGLDPTDEDKRQAVKATMQHAWQCYRQYAWGADELQPLTKRGKDMFGQTGATIIDSLDTLYIMDMKEEFREALDWVEHNFRPDHNREVSVFETTIRVVGGFLAAHDLSGEDAFVHKCAAIVQRLRPAFNTKTGIPYNIVNLASGSAKNPSWSGKASTLAEFGTEQLEFLTLSRKTGEKEYGALAEKSIEYLHNRYPEKDLFGVFINPQTGDFTKDQISFGALGDSFYEYLLKVWILTGKKNEMYRGMWEKAMDGMIERMIQHNDHDDLTYISILDRSHVTHKMEHLACFVGGMLALGVHHGAVTEKAKQDRYMVLAKDLGKTCYAMYTLAPCGLAPEFVTFPPGGGRGMEAGTRYNIQRPEAVETWFYLYRITGDPMYREWGWNVLQSFEKYTRVDGGYAGVKDVMAPAGRLQLDDTMQSFFLAETLKYLYLLFSPKSLIDLDEWIFNTEAHPIRIPKKWP